MNSEKSFFTRNFWIAISLTVLFVAGAVLLGLLIDDSIGGGKEFPMTAIGLFASAVIFTWWAVFLDAQSKQAGDKQRSISSLNLKDLWQRICNGEADLPSRIMGPLAVACFTGGGILFVWSALVWDERSRSGSPWGTIEMGSGDAVVIKLGLVCAVSALVFIKLLVRTFSNKSKHKLRANSQFGHVIRSPTLPALVTASVVIIITTILLIAWMLEVFGRRGDELYLKTGTLFLGSGSLILMWMFGLRRISQQAKVLSSSPADSTEETGEDVLDKTSTDDGAGENLGLWSGAINAFIKNTSGLIILMLTAFTPISIATYFLLNPKDWSNLNNFGLIQIWALPVGGIIGYLFLRPLAERARWIRRFAKIHLGLILIISGGTGLFVSIENYRGNRAWNNFKKEWEAKEVSFDKKSYIPAQIPKEKNFSFTPILSPLRSQDVGLARSGRLKEIAEAGGHFYSLRNQRDKLMAKGLVINLSHKQGYFRRTKWQGWPVPPEPQTPAKDVLLALSHFKSDFEQLKKDSISRPLANYGGLNTDSQPIHHSPIANLCNFLILRARAHIQDDQPDAACADVRLLYFLAGTIGAEPLLGSTSVYTKICMTGRVPIWEGLVLGQWKPEHLAAIQVILEKHDLLKAVKPAILGSTFWESLPDFESLIGQRDQLKGFSRDLYRFDHIQLKPRGWVRQNQVTLCQLVLEQILPQFDTETHRYYPSKEYVPIQLFEPSKSYRFLLNNTALWVLPAMKIPENQTKLDLMIIACSLEHHRLTNGEYPQLLDGIKRLNGKDLPHEVFTGEPYIYHRLGQEQGAYKLRSVGINRKDDKGDPKSDIVWIPKGKIAPAKN